MRHDETALSRILLPQRLPLTFSGQRSPKLQDCMGAYAEANDIGAVDTKTLHHGRNVMNRTLPAIGRRILGNVTQQISASVI